MPKNTATHEDDRIGKTSKSSLIKTLKDGERSGFIAHFDRNEFLKDLRRKLSTTCGYQ